MTGKFITIDGIEGAGKSTQITFISNYLTKQGIKVLTTREPGGSVIGDKIRELLLDNNNNICHDTELMLMFAARCEHIEKTIKPALNRGEWVLSDRFSDASFAYQGGGRGIDMKRIAQLIDWSQQGFSPDLTFCLDIPIDITLKRINQRGNKDRFENEDVDFFKRVRAVFLDLAQQYPQRIKLIDASSDISTVNHIIKIILDDFLCAIALDKNAQVKH